MRARPAFLLLPLIAACELTEVTVPLGEPRVVVHAVLSRVASEQFVIVEEARVGQTDDLTELPPEGTPRNPISDATVTLTYAPGTRCAPAVDVVLPAPKLPGIYRARGLCITDPGDALSLRVETRDGRVVTGSTTMPGARTVAVWYGDTLGPQPLFGSFNRDHDTLHIDVEPVLARAMQIEIRRSDQTESIYLAAQDPLVFYAVLDTLGLTFPGNLINPFEGDSGETVLRAGIRYDVTVAVTDTNYYDFARSFSDPLTGRGFINHLEGGLGVFGAVEAHTHGLRVVADVDEAREGVYRLQGTLDGLPVDVTLELYLDELAAGVFAAFIEGTWFGEPIDRSVDGIFADEVDEPDRFEAGIEIRADSVSWYQWALRGTRAPQGQGFRVDVVGSVGRGETVTGTLDAVQLSGPTPVSRTGSSGALPGRTSREPCCR